MGCIIVTTMYQMFYDAESFNGDMSNWNVSNVTTMTGMFNNASNFNSDISNWNISSLVSNGTASMFKSAINFNQRYFRLGCIKFRKYSIYVY